MLQGLGASAGSSCLQPSTPGTRCLMLTYQAKHGGPLPKSSSLMPLSSVFLSTAFSSYVRWIRLKSLFIQDLITAFFTGTNYMEGVDDVFAEWRQKFITTYLLAMAFWVPAQTVNFYFLRPQYRVLFVGACTFVEISLLCFIKRWEMED